MRSPGPSSFVMSGGPVALNPPTIWHMRRLPSTAVLSIAIGGMLVGPTAATAAADTREVVRVAHPAITATVIDVGPTGASAGDLRTYWTKLTAPGRPARIGFMSGSLLTTAVNKPRSGYELRTAALVFTIGRAANQLEVGGIASYRQQAATVSRDESVIRPVVGGSGRYAGATGWCRSTHKADNTWRHTFHLFLPDASRKARG